MVKVSIDADFLNKLKHFNDVFLLREQQSLHEVGIYHIILGISMVLNDGLEKSRKEEVLQQAINAGVQICKKGNWK